MRGMPGFDGTDAARLRDTDARPPTGADGATIQIHGNTASFHQE
jgi:hypothetical protein